MFFCASSITTSRSPMPAMLAAVLVALSVRFSPMPLVQRLQPFAQGPGQGLLRRHRLGELAADFALVGQHRIQPRVERGRFRRRFAQGKGQNRRAQNHRNRQHNQR